MPSGKTHDRINFLVLPVFLVGLLSVGFFSILFALIFSFGFIVGTLLLGPDLDIRSKLWRRWGAFKFIWTPYQKMFGHRSIFTHGFIIGDIVRIVYLVIWLYLLIILPSYAAALLRNEMLVGLYYILGIMAFMILVNILSRGYVGKQIKKVYKKNKIGVIISVVMVTIMILSGLNWFSIHEYSYQLYLKNPYAIWFFPLGVVLASTVHITSDIVVSGAKRLVNQYVANIALLIIIAAVAYYLSNLIH